MTTPPVPPAQPGEHQFRTDPILRGETQVRLEHFRSLEWLPPNLKPKALSMRYNSSRQAAQELGRDARFNDDVGHYNYRRWTANEVNRMLPTIRLILVEGYLRWGQTTFIRYLTADHREFYQPGTAEGTRPVW